MSADIHADRILIIDFGSQYTQLIARRVRHRRIFIHGLRGSAMVESDALRN